MVSIVNKSIKKSLIVSNTKLGSAIREGRSRGIRTNPETGDGSQLLLLVISDALKEYKLLDPNFCVNSLSSQLEPGLDLWRLRLLVEQGDCLVVDLTQAHGDTTSGIYKIFVDKLVLLSEFSVPQSCDRHVGRGRHGVQRTPRVPADTPATLVSTSSVPLRFVSLGFGINGGGAEFWSR